MSRSILLATLVVKFEKGFLPTPTSFGGYSLIGYHCTPSESDLLWDTTKAEESMVASMTAMEDRLATANATKTAWAALSDERKAVILVVAYLSTKAVKPADVKEVLTAIVADVKHAAKPLWDLLQPEQPRKLIERLRKSLRCGEVCALYPMG